MKEARISGIVEVFKKKNPGVEVDYQSAGAGKLMAKIAVTRGVAAKLVELGKESGSIDVTDVSEAIYSP